MDSEPVIEVSNLSKDYRIWKSPGMRWRSVIFQFDYLFPAEWVRRLAAQSYEDFTALQPINMKLRRGESVAIIGRNGSGKSTLLQIIAGTLTSTDGYVRCRGQVAALLELGSGFDPEFTGRENIYLNGAIFGLSKEQVTQKLPLIEAFADIGDYLEQPVKTYSSGMRMRLAFAVLTAVDPEILIVDEALSVGDVFFQSKCARWMEGYVQKGGTLLCVSHDTYLIQRICRRAIVLDHGRVLHDGDINAAINLYYRLVQEPLSKHRKPEVLAGELQPAATSRVDETGWYALSLRSSQHTGDGSMRISKVWTDHSLDEGFSTGEWLTVRIQAEACKDMDWFDVGFGFRDRAGMLMGGFHSYYHQDLRGGIVRAGECCEITFRIQLMLAPQTYLLLVGLAQNFSPGDWKDLDCYWDCARIRIVGEDLFWGYNYLPIEDGRTVNLSEKAEA